MRRPVTPDSVVCAAHRRLCAQLGRAPTAAELARAAGLYDASVARRMRRLGLARTRLTRSEAARLGAEASVRTRRAIKAQKATAPRKDGPMEARMRAERERRRRYWAVARSGEGGGQPQKRLPRPGEGMPPWARVTIACAICGREVTITPRTHPWYMRDADGAVRFLCSEPCMRGVDT